MSITSYWRICKKYFAGPSLPSFCGRIWMKISRKVPQVTRTWRTTIPTRGSLTFTFPLVLTTTRQPTPPPSGPQDKWAPRRGRCVYVCAYVWGRGETWLWGRSCSPGRPWMFSFISLTALSMNTCSEYSLLKLQPGQIQTEEITPAKGGRGSHRTSCSSTCRPASIMSTKRHERTKPSWSHRIGWFLPWNRQILRSYIVWPFEIINAQLSSDFPSLDWGSLICRNWSNRLLWLDRPGRTTILRSCYLSCFGHMRVKVTQFLRLNHLDWFHYFPFCLNTGSGWPLSHKFSWYQSDRGLKSLFALLPGFNLITARQKSVW